MSVSLKRIADWLFSSDPRRRIRLAQTGLALLLVMVCCGAMAYAVWAGFARAVPAVLWAVASLGGIGGAFLAIRAGWSERLGDPSLTLAQIVWSLACCAAGYVIAGPMRGAVFPILMVVLMFGMFGLRPHQVRYVSAYAVLLFSLTMSLAAWFNPGTFSPLVELGHFIMIAAMVPTVPVLAARLAWLRQQRRDLASALDRVRDLARHDELTGLPNRRHMLELIDNTQDRAARTGAPFCLAVIDIDHFKQVNDAHGHAVGDEVLRVFSRQALAAVRTIDVLGRWGGEEFVLLLTDAKLPFARQAVERVRSHIESMVVLGDHAAVNITLSAGVAEHSTGESGTVTLQRADTALYRAKDEGRNRVACG
jgi:diguanylate cyclase